MKQREYLNTKYISSKYGPYTIINDYGIHNNKHIVDIRFDISGGIARTTAYKAINGIVRDPYYGVDFNKIYYSDNYGPYKIINIYKGKSKLPTRADVCFINTNYIKNVTLQHALNGDIKDITATNKIPIDTLILDECDRNNRLIRLAKAIWYDMHKRCSNKNADNYNIYGGSGVKICEEWNDINVFLQDIIHLNQYEKWYRFPTLYQLDKDYLQFKTPKNNKIYSPETCMFLHYLDNINLMIIENKQNNYKISNNKYFGVTLQSSGTYGVSMRVNNNYLYLGTYDDEIIAANVFNYWIEYYHNYDIVPLLNDVPYIPKEEFIKHNTNPKIICRKIERQNL